jgi:hypothetical protein
VFDQLGVVRRIFEMQEAHDGSGRCGY